MTGPHHCGICHQQLRYHTAQDTYSCPNCRITITAEALYRRHLGDKPHLIREYRDIRPDGKLLQFWSQHILASGVPFDYDVPSYLGEWQREVRELLSDGTWVSSWQTVITNHESDLLPVAIQPSEHVLPKEFLAQYKDLIDSVCGQAVAKPVSGSYGIMQTLPHETAFEFYASEPAPTWNWIGKTESDLPGFIFTGPLT